MSIAGILLGITLIVWSLGLLGLAAISPVILGLLALITGIVWLISGFYPLNIPIRRA